MIEIEKDDISPILERRPQLIQNISDVLAQRAAHNERVKSGADQDKNTSENSKNIAKKILKFFFNK